MFNHQQTKEGIIADMSCTITSYRRNVVKV